MKKTMFTVMVVLLSISVAYAAQNVRNTKHNLTATTSPYYTTATDRVCVFCHTPHFASTGNAPLWNRELPTGPYNMYTSATIDMTIQSSPKGVSLACLSCHDGTVAFDSLANAPGSGGVTTTPTSLEWTFAGGGNTMTDTTSPAAMLGTDLTNDHPISITYDTSKDSAFHSIAEVKTGGLTLYGSDKDQVECGSCHNPHEDTLPTFLRISNENSDLCLTCHIK